MTNESDDYDVKEVLKIVAEGGKDIESCTGKDVIAFFGLQQVGKSTTINALKFGPLKIKSRARSGNVAYDLPPGASAVGNGRIGCTKSPAGYPIDDDLVLLDTRGFFDVRYPNEMVAATILTDMALRHAKSVRLVFLQRIDNFLNGHAGMRTFGEIFGKFVKNDSIPVLFLFNNCRFEVSGEGEEKQRNIVEELKNLWKEIISEQKELWTDTMKRVIQRIRVTNSKPELNKLFTYDNEQLLQIMLGEKTVKFSEEENRLFSELVKMIQNDAEFVKLDEECRYLRAMKKAFEQASTTATGKERGTVGFIDPSDDYSIKELKRIMRDISPISTDFLDFSQYNDYVKRFHQFFAGNIHRFVHLLRGQELLIKYPHELVTRLIEQRNTTIKECENDLQDIKTNDDKEKMSKYEKKYSLESFSNRIQALELEEVESRTICERLRNEVKEFEAIPPEIKRKEWNVEGFHPQHRVKYENDAPFTFTVETGDGTEETEVISKDEHNFDVVYSNGNWLRSVGHSVNVVAQAFVKLFDLELLSTGLQMLDNKLVVSCCGRVTFKIRPQDIPENKRSLEELIKRADAWDRRAKEAVEKREKFSSDSVKNVGEKIATIMEGAAKEKDMLLRFEHFRETLTQFLAKESDAIDLHRKSALVIFSERNKTIDSDNFLRLSQKISEGGVAVVTEESKVNLSELDVEDLEKFIEGEIPQKGTPPQ